MNRTSFKNNRLTSTDPEDHTTRINVWTDRFVTMEGIAMKVILKKV